jgi:hypothetical protein
MFVSRHKTSVQNQYEKLTNIPFGNVGKLKCLTMTLANPNCIYEEFMSRINSENACCYEAQNLLSFLLLSKIISIKINA